MEVRLLSTSLLLLLLLAPLFLHNPCFADLHNDSRSLLAFLHGLNASSPRLTTNWSNLSSPCTWIGVSCDRSNTSVQKLKLPGLALVGNILPNTLGSLPQLQLLSLRYNRLSGSLPDDLLNCTQLRNLFLQNNLLSGSILAFSDSNIPNLNVINLSFNGFVGDIPPSLATLNRLTTLFLQNNSLTGSIPPGINSAGKLVNLNLENNELSGNIPTSLQNFPSSTFSGNPALCGPPLPSVCASMPPSKPPPSSPTVVSPPSASVAVNAPQHKSKKKLTTLDIVLIVLADAVFLLLIGGCCVFCWLRKMKNNSPARQHIPDNVKAGVESKEEFSSAQEPERNKLVFFRGVQHAFDLEDLLRASAEVLGKGSFGTTYKAVLEDGSTVVVKRLKEVALEAKEFEQQMDSVGRMRHSNLVPMRAYYYSKEEKLLIYDYVPQGSLCAALHGGTASALDWETRLKIAMATARGLGHLHAASINFTHGDLKSSNVLLQRKSHACLSDFGLASLSTANAAASRNVGYRAPEVAGTRKVTQKSDIYSYGVLLLELLTGKPPFLPSGDGGMDLPRWVKSVVREEWTSEVFDMELMKNQNENIDGEMVQTLQIALACVSTAPDQRPDIKDVIKMIDDVREFVTDDGITVVQTSTSTEENSNESGGAADAAYNSDLQRPSAEYTQESSTTTHVPETSTDQSV